MKTKKNPFDKLDETIEINTPTQIAVSINEKLKKRDNEKSYTLYLDKNLLKKLKQYSLDNDTNMKEVIKKILIDFLK